MEEKRSPIFAGMGIGGAALAAALVTMGGSSSTSSTESHGNKQAVVQSSEDHADITSNQEGPWYAFCQEYATTEFDHGEDPAQQRGIKGHRVPEEAEEGTAEISKKIIVKGKEETETFHVKRHTIGELSSCIPKFVGKPGANEIAESTLRVVVATVPDPNATQMRLDFDRDVAAIQRAAAEESYNYTRFWFPWRGDDWIADKTEDPELEIRRRQEPGILCFRKNGSGDNGDQADRLFVLLVGETPTSGVNRIQFAHALYYAKQLTAPTIKQNGQLVKNPSQRDQLDVAGPLFSASFNPIQDVLKKLDEERIDTNKVGPELEKNYVPEPLREASLVSPRTSGQEFINEFNHFCDTNTGLCKLETLALSSSQVREQALGFLKDLGYDHRVVAQLSEDESAFGESQIRSSTDSTTTPGSTSIRTPEADCDKETKPNPAGKCEPDYGMKLHFPRDMSSVRNLSDEESAKVAEAGSKYFSLPRGSLPTRLAASEPIDRDSPAAFGAEQEMAEVARSLADSVAQMRLHHIRAVVITASNPLDRIYLLEYLHNQLPDLRAMTVDADTLELDRPHFVDLTGTFAVTTMPPLSGMLHTIVGNNGKPVDHTFSFASSSQEGEFLAVDTLLQKNTDTTTPKDDSACLYFSIVGANGFRLIPKDKTIHGSPRFPCAITKSVPGSDTMSIPPPEQFLTAQVPERLPNTFVTFSFVILAWNIFHFLSLANSWHRKEGFFSYAAELVKAQEPDRVYLLFAVNNQLLIADVILSWLAWQCLRSDAGPGWDELALWSVLCIFALLAFVAAGLMVVLFLRFIRSLKRPSVDQKLLGGRWTQMIVAALYLASSLWMAYLLPFHAAGEGIFLERITQLGDHLSPLLPIMSILLGYFLWGLLHLRRLAWAASRKPHLAFVAATDEFLHERVDSVQTYLAEVTPSNRGITIVSSIFAVLVAAVLHKSLNGLEGYGISLWWKLHWSFSVWFTIWGVGMLLATVTMTSLHAWLIWTRLRKLLLWLETTEMSGTFIRLGQNGVLQVKMWDLTKMEKNLSFLRSTVDSVRSLNGPTSRAAKIAEIQFNRLLDADRDNLQLQPRQIERFSRTLNVSMDAAVKALPIKTASILNRAELREYLALRLIAMIRYAMLHIGAMITFVAYGFGLAVVSIMFYPFEGRKTIGGLLAIAFVALLTWIGVMILQFQSNEMLSHLGGAKSGETNYRQAALHLLTVGGLPLIAILTSQFPGIANFAYTFFGPLLSALH